MHQGCFLQDYYAPQSMCFGCGPVNQHGLRLRSQVSHDQEVIAYWKSEPFHEAFPGILNGGIVGTLLDCHSNWSAAFFLMNQQHQTHPPCTVTARYAVELHRPTPSQTWLYLVASPLSLQTDRAVVQAKILIQNQCYASCEGTFVAVKPGHPAFHRW